MHALADAIAFCAREDRPLPSWASHGALAAIAAQLAAPAIGRLGRHASREAGHRSDMLHYERWSLVRELQDRADELQDIASTQEERYAAVARLQGTAAAGSEETIKRSYLLVERAMGEGRGARFYLPSG